jgi:hypothetical protein
MPPKDPDRGGAAGDRYYPVSGIAVIDLARVYNGPYATFLQRLPSRGDIGGLRYPSPC